MLETAIIAFTTLFATIGPPDVAVLFAALTPDETPAQRRNIALKGVPDGRWRAAVADCHRYGLCPSFRQYLDHR